jgi:hypothetical protein
VTSFGDENSEISGDQNPKDHLYGNFLNCDVYATT